MRKKKNLNHNRNVNSQDVRTRKMYLLGQAEGMALMKRRQQSVAGKSDEESRELQEV